MAYIWRPPSDLKISLEKEAREIGISMNSLLILICRKYLQKESG